MDRLPPKAGPGNEDEEGRAERPAQPAPAYPAHRIVALVISISLFMLYLDSTILTTALPAIARDMHVEPMSVNVLFQVYQAALAVFIPLGSALGAKLGNRGVYVGSLLLFMAGSLTGYFSSSFVMLAFARLMQGVAGAAMIPIGRLILVRATVPSQLVSALNWLMVPAIVGPLLGPPLGGIITTYTSWHNVFLINVPIAILGMILVLTIIPACEEPPAGPFDLKGFLLVGPVIGFLVFGLEMLANARNLMGAVLLLSASALCGFGYFLHARRVAAPLIELKLMAIPSFRFSMAAGALVRMVSAGISFIVPLWFQLAFGMTSARSGAISFALVGGTLLSRVCGGWLVQRFRPRSIMMVSPLFSVALLLVCSRFHAETPLPLFYIMLACLGLALSTPVMVSSALAYVDMPRAKTAAATGFYTTVQQLTISFGITMIVAAINLSAWLQSASTNDGATYSGAFCLAATFCLFATFLAWRASPGAGQGLRAG